MVYDTLRMHYNSPIPKSYIYNHTQMDALYMYVYVHYGIYMCIYTDIHVMDLFMYYGYINVFIYLYIYAVFFCVCVCVCEHVCENVSVSVNLIYPFKKKLPFPPLPHHCSPTGPSVVCLFSQIVGNLFY